MSGRARVVAAWRLESVQATVQTAVLAAVLAAVPAAALAADAAAGQAATDDAVLALRPPVVAQVSWRGMLPSEGGAVGIGPQIGPYVVPNAAGLLVAIFTHGAVMSGVQAAEAKRAQADADRVLAPYAEVLQGWTAPALWDAALAAAAPGAEGAPRTLWRDGEGPAGAVRVDVLPVYTLVQDESALQLDASLKFSRDGDLPRETVVRVVSSPHGAAESRGHWLADDGRQLKAAAGAMLAHAVQVGYRHGAAAGRGEGEPPRTHRYLQGSVERAERAQRLAGDCARAVLRTLRGALMSVPLRPPDGGVCEAKSTF